MLEALFGLFQMVQKFAARSHVFCALTYVKVRGQCALMRARYGKKSFGATGTAKYLHVLARHNASHAKSDKRNVYIRFDVFVDKRLELNRHIVNTCPAISRFQSRNPTLMTMLLKRTHQMFESRTVIE